MTGKQTYTSIECPGDRVVVENPGQYYVGLNPPSGLEKPRKFITIYGKQISSENKSKTGVWHCHHQSATLMLMNTVLPLYTFF